MKTIYMVCMLAVFSGACAQTGDRISELDRQLQSGAISVSDILSRNDLMHLHPETEFRQVIKRNAPIGRIEIAAATEPGVHITVKGTVLKKDGSMYPNVLIYFYHTSDKGWYAADAPHILVQSGDVNHARLFGYVRTDASGGFTIETIKPKGYPDSDLPAHIHIHFNSEDGKSLYAPGELLFDDDARLTPGRRERSLADGFLIAKNSAAASHPVYEYVIEAD